MDEKLDIIVFGATGFTGRQAVETLIKLGQEYGIKWGVSGRNESKLVTMLKEISDKRGTDITKIPKFVADVGDEKSLEEMASHAVALVNCCGPYRFYGEPVVKACIKVGTHQIDVSGEPQFMETMQLNYHKEAEEKGVYIISACGFDSLVAELGIIHMMAEFKGQLNSIETYLQLKNEGNERKGAGLHFGTWESAIYSLVHADELRPLREKLFPKRLPNFTPKLRPRSLMHKSSIVNKWCLPFPGSDRSIALRTQRYFYEQEKKRPVQIQTYIAFGSLFATLTVALIGIIFGIMVKTSFTRRLLLNFPWLFSFGLVSHEGPSEEKRVNTVFDMTFYGQGWAEKKENPDENPSDPPSQVMITKASGYDPGYGFTVTALILSAFTVLKESSNMPGNGGVYPPGAAFAKTSLLEELKKNGLKVEIISNSN
ncbi:saccharopine dehydrogenase-like oxidoreductase [Lycorma delicatula]|uniref:saccharopine dehydrogenase-like oxidoreductase n=1 Tax=Lycorma delicatula TaxID=130591 RepID=UPI003F518706